MPLDFKKLMCARFLFTFAVQMQAVLIGWLIYDLLKDPLALGLVGLVEAIPALGLALYAGNMIDKSRPMIVYRRVIMVSFTSGSLILIGHYFSDSLGVNGQVMMLYASSMLTGVARALRRNGFAHAAQAIRQLPKAVIGHA